MLATALQTAKLGWADPVIGKTFSTIWERFERAVAQPLDPWRTPVFATSSNGNPHARIVVLREANPSRFQLTAYSDSRVEKIQDLRNCNRSEWVFYDPLEGVQCRARGVVSVHIGDSVCQDHWRRVPQRKQANYCSVHAPGFELKDTQEKKPSPSHLPSFAVLVASIDQMDWLQLRDELNVRMRFNLSVGSWGGHNVVP